MATTEHRVGIAGLVHDHVWGLAPGFATLPNVTLVAAADPNEPLRDKARERLGVDALYADWRAMLASERLDIVLVTCENSGGAEIVEAAAARGVHALVEKPMAATLAQADRMLAASRRAGTKLLVNWATAWRPNLVKAVELVREGAIGQVFDVRVRMAHHGPRELGCSQYFWGWLYDEEKNGAGAYMDYCCYGAAFCRHLLGRPQAVFGWRDRLVKDDIAVDDNGMIVLFYEKAIGRTEASWCQVPDYHDLVILGSKGTLATSRGKLLMSTEPRKPLEEVELPELPAGFRSGPEHLVYCLDNGLPVEGMCSAEVGRDAQEILEAGLVSARTGQRINLRLG